MRKLSAAALAKTVASRRKAMKITQAQLAETTGINRALLSRIYLSIHEQSRSRYRVVHRFLGAIWGVF